MITYRGIANRLLRYIGVTSLSAAANSNSVDTRGLDPQDIPDVVACIQGALEEAWTFAPSGLVEREAGGVLRPPASITLNVTQYSAACAVTGWQSWMAGCTVRIAGDGLDNRFISSTELLRPFMGSTVTGVASTVYVDCLAVPTTYNTVIEPVRFPHRPKLSMANSREEFYRLCAERAHNNDTRQSYFVENKEIGEPTVAMADFEALGTAAPQLYLRFNPMPAVAYAVTYTGRIAPPTITEANIWNENSPDTDPAVYTYLPNASSTVLAFALQRWTAHSSFSPSGQQLTEIARQYGVAKTIMQRRKAQVASTQAVYTE